MTEEIVPDLSTRYLPYLVEIRRRFFFIGSLFIIGTVLGFIFYERVIRFILKLFQFEGVNIVFTSPFQFIELAVNSSILIGLIVAFPMIIYQILAFTKPALSRREYRRIIFLIPLSLFLFLLGFIYGAMMMRSTLEIFYNQTQSLGVGNMLDVVRFLSTTMTTAILLGIAFEFPIILTLLVHFRVVNLSRPSKLRRIFYLGSFIFVIFLPPTDIISNIILILPLLILFELTVFFNKTILKPKD